MDPGINPAEQVNVYRQITSIWRSLFFVFFYTSLSIGPLLVSPAQAIVTDTSEISLPEGQLHQALIELGKQTQVSIIFPSQLPDAASPNIYGQYSPLQALEQLIEGLELEYRITGPDTILVLPRCYAARACPSMQDDLQFSMQQYSIMEELVIRGKPLTGSRFKQLNTVGFSPVEIITGSEIRLTGAQTMAELMRFTPQVVGNSTSTAVSNGGNGTASATLRGLPATNTLVLVNGQRVAKNALDGSSVDLNSIPLAAVDRIEILKGSGSSIYGSDAIAGVINVILKKRFKGSLVNAFYGISDAGDSETVRYDFVAGLMLEKVDLVFTASHYSQKGIFSRDRAISASANGRGLGGIDRRSSATPNARLRLGNDYLVLATDNLSGSSTSDFRQATEADLFDYAAFTSSLAPAERDSFHLAAELKDLGSVDAAFELTYVDSNSLITLAPVSVLTAFAATPLRVSADNSYNPFGQTIDDARIRLLGLGPRLQSNQSKTARVQGRILGNIEEGEWQLSVNWSQTKAREQWQNLLNLQHLAEGLGAAEDCQNDCVPINIFAPTRPQEQLEHLRTGALNQGHTELLSVNLDLSQLLDILPAGNAEFASGIEFRREQLHIISDQRLSGQLLVGANSSDSTGSRNTAEMYLESLIPLARDIPWVYSLEANVSFRLTYSNDFTVRANPKLALRYRPTKELMLRTNLSTGFRAPSLYELQQVQSSTQVALYDPCSSAENVADLTGCAVATDPLRSQYNVIGGGNVLLRPETSKHISLGLLYKPAGLENFTFGVDIFAINVDQVIGANAQFIVNQNASNGLFSDQLVRSGDGELISVMASNNNIGSRQIRGADMDLSWRIFIASWGTLGVNMGGAYIDSHRFKIDPAMEAIELAGTFVDKAAQGSGSIPRWKSRLNLFWQFGRWEFSLASMHVSSLTEFIVSEDRFRDSGAWSREDVQVSYHFNSGESLITLGVENILDQMPPFLGSAFNDNFDARTHDSTGRFIYARLSHSL